MRVRFEATFDEFMDVAIRSWQLQHAALPFWRRDPVIGALLTAAILSLATPSPVVQKLVVAAIGGIFGAFFYPRYRQLTFKRSANRLYREWLGGQPAAAVEIEPRDRGLWVAQNSTEVLYPWRDVTAVDDSAADVQICFRYEGLIVVRTRAFADAATRSAFLAELEDRRAGATQQESRR
ncbi:MAG TPA: hypothetical protein VES67_23330 [Vicinamibacterales bacterium]|nr:hypothetical protein [Vicinamibacterales bacterium]